jgi:hypothetical protein
MNAAGGNGLLGEVFSVWVLTQPVSAPTPGRGRRTITGQWHPRRSLAAEVAANKADELRDAAAYQKPRQPPTPGGVLDGI